MDNRQSKFDNSQFPPVIQYNFHRPGGIFRYQMERLVLIAAYVFSLFAGASAVWAFVGAEESRGPATKQVRATTATGQPAAAATQSAIDSRRAGGDQSTTIKVEVNLVPVEVSVRDHRGRPLENLTRDDFRILEDGIEQQIRYFSQAELPLALTLVVDSSTSVAAALADLRMDARETLSLLKPDDQVALYSFTDKPELVRALTTDRAALAEDIAAISPGGGTDINDALYEAAHYLGSAAPGRRHAIILVSDNEATDPAEHDDSQVIRAALDNTTVIYSIKVGNFEHSKWYYLTHSDPALGSVEKDCRETGGTVLDSRSTGSVTSALATLIAWLKEGYSLAYTSTNRNQDGAFRRIEVHLAPRFSGRKYTINARQGYYAPQQ